MRLPMRSWKKTLGKLGLRVDETKTRRKSVRQPAMEALESRVLLTVDPHFTSDDFSNPAVVAAAFTPLPKFELPPQVDLPQFDLPVDRFRSQPDPADVPRAVSPSSLLTAALAQVNNATDVEMTGGVWQAQFDGQGKLSLRDEAVSTKTPQLRTVQSSLVIQGEDNVDDSLSLDLGALPRLANGQLAVKTIVYHGGIGGYDTLKLNGGSFQYVSYTITGRDSGILKYDDLTIIFTGLEPVVDTTSASSLTINATDNADTIYAVDGTPSGGYDTIRVYEASAAFEEVTFANKTNVTINAMGGNDTVYLNYTRAATGLSTVTVDGGSGHDNLNGGVLAETLLGNSGDDALVGGLGDDTLNGGSGSDQFFFWGTSDLGSDTVVEAANADRDTLVFDDFGAAITVDLSSTLPQTVASGKLVLTLSSSIGIEGVNGTAYGDNLTGNSLINFFRGAGGDDTIAGGDGGDYYYFDGAADLGSDTLIESNGNSGQDTLVFEGMAYGVTVDLSTTSTQTVVSEKLELTLSSATSFETLIGSNYDDVLTGSSISNTFYDTPGNDVMTGGGGSDYYNFSGTGNLGNNTIIEAPNADTDVLSFEAFAYGINLDLSSTATQTLASGQLSLTLSSATGLENVYGTNYDDTITGNSRSNVFNGWGGDDTLTGGDGQDYYFYSGSTDLGSDTIIESATDSGQDLLNFESMGYGVSVDLSSTTMQTVVSGKLNLKLQNANGIELLFGSQHDDTLTGDSIANAFWGEGGNDVMTGGGGSDAYYFTGSSNLGSDTIVEDASGDNDALVFEQIGAGVDVDLGSTATRTIASGILSLTLSSALGIETVYGSQFSDTIRGNANSNIILGEGGDDTLEGGDGWDYYYYAGTGDQGSDTIVESSSGTGEDTLLFTNFGYGVTVDLSSTSTQTVTSGKLSLTFSPDAGIEHIYGSLFDDHLTGNSSANYLIGLDGNDVLDGGGGNDYIVGGAGNDSLTGGTGDDSIYGEGGNDYYSFTGSSDLGSDHVYEDPTADAFDWLSFAGLGAGITIDLSLTTQQTIASGLLNLTLNSSTGFEVVNGTAFDDFMYGNSRGNTFYGNAGDDWLEGRDGGEFYRFEGSFDLGHDTIVEQSGSGSDQINFGYLNLDDDDSLDGVIIDLADDGVQTVAQTTVGGVQSSRLQLTLVNPEEIEGVYGSPYQDTMYGNSNNNYLYGFSGNDTIVGRDGNDVLFGDDGNDSLTGGAGNDTLTGGAGDDTYFFSGSSNLGSDTITEDASADSDTLDFSGMSANLNVNMATYGSSQTIASGLLVLTLSTATSIENVIGGSGNDIVTGNNRDNIIRGGAGNDSLHGNNGNDLLDGGSGDDTLVGGANNDTYYYAGDIDHGHDTIIESSGGGTDSLDFTNLDLDDDDSVDGIALDLNQVDLPNVASVTVGGVTSNRLQLTFDDLNVEAFRGPISIENVYGTAYADTITTSSSTAVVYGLAGDDTLIGLAGNGSLYGGDGNDTLQDGNGNQSLFGDDGDDIMYAEAGSDTFTGGSGTDTCVFLGTSGNDSFEYDGATITLGTAIKTVTGLEKVVIDGVAGDDSLSLDAGTNTWTISGSTFSPDGYPDIAVANVESASIETGSNITVIGDQPGIGRSSLKTINITGSGSNVLEVDSADNNSTFGDSIDVDSIAGGINTVRINGGPNIVLDSIDLDIAAGAGDDVVRVAAWSGGWTHLSIDVGAGQDSVDLSGNNLEGIALPAIVGAESLNLSHAQLASLPTFPSGIVSLDLRYNELDLEDSNLLDNAAAISTLQQLYLHGNDGAVPDLQSLKNTLIRIDLAPVGLEQAEKLQNPDGTVKSLDDMLEGIAKSLHYLPLEIYDYVRNSYTFQLYLGVMKGSQSVILTKAGNDYELALLLRELFEKAGVDDEDMGLYSTRPDASHVGGILIDHTEAMQWLGVTSPAAALDVIATLGQDADGHDYYYAFPSSDKIAIEHTWLQFQKGTEIYQLDPSWKITSLSSAADAFLAKYNFDNTSEYTSVGQIVADTRVGSFIDPNFHAYYRDVTDQSPTEWFEDRIAQFLSESSSGLTMGDLGYVSSVAPIYTTANSLPTFPGSGLISNNTNSGVGFTAANSSLDEQDASDVANQTWRIRIKVEISSDQVTWYPDSHVAEVAIPDASLSPIGVSWSGSGNDFDLTIEHLELNGATTPILTRSWGNVSSSWFYRVSVGFWKPGVDDTDDPTQESTSGAFGFTEYATIGLEANQITGQFVSALQQKANLAAILRDASYTSSFDRGNVLDVLALAANKYFQRTEEGQAIADNLLHTIQNRNAVGVGFAAGSKTTAAANPTLQQPYVPNGIKLDISKQSFEAISIEGDADAQDFRTELGGANAGAQEGLVLQELFNSNAVSTVKLLQYATSHSGPDIDSITSLTWTSEQSEFNWNSTLKSLIGSLVSSATVYAPNQAISIGGTSYGAALAVYPDHTSVWYIVQGTKVFRGGGVAGTPVDDAPLGSRAYDALSGDQVNIINGAVTQEITDINIPAPGLPLTFTRYYDSSTAGDPTLGIGWWSNYSDSLAISGSGVIWTNSHGNKLAFGPYSSTTKIHSPITPSVFGELRRRTNGGTTELWYRDKNGLTYKFYWKTATAPEKLNDPAYDSPNIGKLREIQDAYGNKLTIDRDSSGRVASVEAVRGSFHVGKLVFTYVSGKLSTITADLPSGTDRVWTYSIPTYSATKNSVTKSYSVLSQVDSPTDPITGASTVVKYSYYVDNYFQDKGYSTLQLTGSELLNKLATVETIEHTSSSETTLSKFTHTYYPNGRAFRTIDGEGNAKTYQYNTYQNTYESNEVKRLRRTTVTDERGNDTIFAYQNTGQIVRTTFADRSTTLDSFDSNGRKLSHTDPYGVITQFLYDGGDNYELANVTTEKQGKFKYFDLSIEYDVNNWQWPSFTSLYWTQLQEMDRDALGELVPIDLITTYEYTTLRTDHDDVTAIDVLQWSKVSSIALPSAIHDAEGRSVRRTEYYYDVLGNAADGDEDDGALEKIVETIGIDSSDQPITQVTHFYYRANGTLLRRIDPRGQDDPNIDTNPAAAQYATKYEYDISGQVSKIIQWVGTDEEDDPIYSTELFAYDDYYHLQNYINANGYDTQFAGNPVADQSPYTTTYTVDVLGRRTNTVQPVPGPGLDQPEFVDIYNGLGNVLGSTFGNDDRVAHYAYDLLQRLTATENPDGSLISNTYDSVGNLIAQTDGLGNLTRFEYDSRNRLIRTILPDGTFTEVRYGGAGQINSQIDALGRVTASTYDQLGRLVTLQEPAPDEHLPARLYIYQHDAVGNLVEATVANTDDPSEDDRITQYFYDSLGRLEKRIDPSPDGNADHAPMATFEYDAVGNQKRVAIGTADSEQVHVTLSEYDGLNRLTKVTAPDSAIVTTYEYDNAGNLRFVNDPNGNQAEYQYDKLNRLAKEILPDLATGDSPSVIVFSYDTVGNLISQSLQTDDETLVQRTELAYDEMSRPTAERHYGFDESEAAVLLTTATTTYDFAGNVVATTDPYAAGDLLHVTRFGYDSRNRLVSSTNALGARSFVEYDAVGNVKTETDAAGNVTVHNYDNLDREVQTILPDPDGDDIEASLESPVITNQYSPTGGDLIDTYLGTIGTPLDQQRHTSYGYDVLHRQTSVTTRPNQDGIHDENDDSDPDVTTVERVYDVFGNLLSETNASDAGDSVVTYTYDAMNRLVSQTETDPNYQSPIHVVLDDKDAVYSPNNSFTESSSSSAVGKLVRILDSGSKATWVVSGLDSEKDYDVFVTWDDTLAGAASVDYKVYDSAGNVVLEADNIDQTAAITGNTSHGIDWFKLGTISAPFTGALHIVVDSTGVTGDVVVDALRVSETEVAGVGAGTVTTAEPQVFGNNVAITSGATDADLGDGTDFGTVPAGTVRTFTIRNDSVSSYSFDTSLVTLTGANAADFKIVEQPGETGLAPGDSTTFKIQFNPSSANSIAEATVNVAFAGLTLTFVINAKQGLPPRQQVYAYDLNGNLTMEELRSGGVPLTHTEHRYDELNRPTQDHYYAVTPTTLPANDIYSSSVDSYNHTTTHYDVAGNVSSFTDEAGRVTIFEYDALNRQTRVQELGTVGRPQTDTSIQYDAAGNVVSQTQLATVYGSGDPDPKVITRTLSNGKDALLPGHVADYHNVSSQAITSINIVLSGDQSGITAGDFILRSGNTQDPATWSLLSTTPEVSATFNSGSDTTDVVLSWTTGGLYRGWLQVVLLANGNTGLSKPDVFYAGRLSGDFDSDFDVDGADYIAWQVNYPTASGAAQFNGDADGDGDVDGNDFVEWANNLNSLLLEFTAPEDQYRTTIYSYDALNRPIRSTDPLNHSTTTVYDALSNVISTADAKGNTTQYGYDHLNRQTQVIDPRLFDDLPIVTTTSYNEAGNVVKVVDPNANTTEYRYDDLGRLVHEIKSDFDGDPQTTLHYNLRGQLDSYTDQDDRETTYAYDAFGRNIAETFVDGDEILRYAYDADNQISYAEDARGTLSSASGSLSVLRYDYASDPLRRLKTATSSLVTGSDLGSLNQSNQLVYHYDDANQTNDLQSIDVSGSGIDSYAIDYTYDTIGRLIATSIPAVAGVDAMSAAFAWNAAGQLQSILRSDGSGNKLESTYGYDAAGRIVSLRHETPGTSLPTARGSYTYSYYKNDLLKTKEYLAPGSTTPQNNTYTYDASNQLNKATRDGQDTESYDYDANGNRIGTTGAYNRLDTVDGLHYLYSNQGNLDTRTVSGGDYTKYDWDHHNRLTSVTEKTSGDVATRSSTYLYDAFDRRIAKIFDADGEGLVAPLDIETYAYDGNDVLLTRDGSGEATHRYLNGPLVDQILADDKLDGTPEIRWLLGDEQQSVREVTQTDGTSLASIDYDSFGNIISGDSPATADVLVGYTGQVFDVETGLSYYKARYYDPTTGKFLSEDPAGSGMNPYAYVANSTPNFTDPSGMSKLSEFGKKVNHFVEQTGGWTTWAIGAAAFLPTLGFGLSILGDATLTLGVADVGGQQSLYAGFEWLLGSGTTAVPSQMVGGEVGGLVGAGVGGLFTDLPAGKTPPNSGNTDSIWQAQMQHDLSIQFRFPRPGVSAYTIRTFTSDLFVPAPRKRPSPPAEGVLASVLRFPGRVAGEALSLVTAGHTVPFDTAGQVVDAAFGGAGRGATVYADTVTFGITGLHDASVRYQQEAIRDNDVLSQIGYGGAHVAAKATHALAVVGGAGALTTWAGSTAAGQWALGTTVGQASLAAVPYATAVGATASGTMAYYNGVAAYYSARNGNYIEAVDYAGSSLMDTAFAGDILNSAKGVVAPRNVGKSELGNALSGLGRNPLGRNINTLDEFGAGSGFSGVFDVESQKFLAYPSGNTKLLSGNTPLNLVEQFGGHNDVNEALSKILGKNSSNRLGFSMTLDEAGNFRMGWNSGQINVPNPNFPGRTVPPEMRQQVIDAIKNHTGRTPY